MEDRINALSIAQIQPVTDQKKVPTSGTLVQLLTQGLQSQDKDMLEVGCHLICIDQCYHSGLSAFGIIPLWVETIHFVVFMLNEVAYFFFFFFFFS